MKRRTLKPGERVIGGRVFYSAAWLGAAPFEHDPDPFEREHDREPEVAVA